MFLVFFVLEQRFLVGRQFWVIFVVFVAAQITTFPTLQLPLPRWLFVVLIETGLPGALVVLALGQLMPQLITATHPVSMLNAPGSWLVVKFALTLEALGVTNFAWVVTWTAKLVRPPSCCSCCCCCCCCRVSKA